MTPAEWNLLFIVTDQERRPRHWPAGWAWDNLPAMRRLKETGLSFSRAYTPASMCAPARASFLTSSYPQQHRVRRTFGPQRYGYDPGAGEVLPATLRSDLPNLGQLLRSLGYEVVYKGKWHATLPLGGAESFGQADIDALRERFGFAGWNPPEAGNSLSVMSTLGGGTADNDRRFVAGDGSGYGESALDFLSGRRRDDPPFALFLNLVNPHDVFVAPRYLGSASGYDPADFMVAPFTDLEPPPSWGATLSGKPQAQQRYAAEVARTYDGDALAAQYNAFYGYATRLADGWVGRVLETLDSLSLTESTLVFRFADHGEMGLAHNLVEKAYNAYEETIGVPFVVSNPVLFPEPRESDALVSTLDLAPTLAGLFEADAVWKTWFRGQDLSRLIAGQTRDAPDGEVLFCFDDVLEESISPAELPAWLRALRRELDGRDWTYAVYFDALGSRFDYELYDLTADPDQMTNLASAAAATPASEAVRAELHRALFAAQRRLGALPDQFDWPAFEPLLDPMPQG